MDSQIQRFVYHWGEMGVRWGINRSVGQVHALLILSPEPLPADDLVESLGIARSNVSTSLRELQAWGLIRTVHIAGDRRDHFQAIADPWDMFRRVAAERKKRELDPTREVLVECLAALKRERHADKHQLRIFEEYSDFFDSTFSFYDQLQSLSIANLKKVARMGTRIFRLAGIKGAKE